MEQPDSRKKIVRWLDLLDGGRTDNPGWGLVVMGVILLGSMSFALVVEQERLGRSPAILAQLLLGALIVLRGAASLLQERHETLATALRLLSTVGWVVVFALLGISFYSSLGLIGALIGLGLLAVVGVLSIRDNRKRIQRAQPS